MAYKLRFSIPLPPEEAACSLASLLLAIHDVAVDRLGGGMHIGPGRTVRLPSDPVTPIRTVDVTLFFEDDVHPLTVTRALDKIFDHVGQLDTARTSRE